MTNPVTAHKMPAVVTRPLIKRIATTIPITAMSKSFAVRILGSGFTTSAD
jgi:hypothetical protein